DWGIQKTLCGAPVPAAPSTGSSSVAAGVTITTTASLSSTSTSTPTLTKSATTTRPPSFSGALTFSTIERPAGGSSFVGLLTLD
ncbi:hypothetical protein C7212DRAFT_321448, partial [Tuber magnatum]